MKFQQFPALDTLLPPCYAPNLEVKNSLRTSRKPMQITRRARAIALLCLAVPLVATAQSGPGGTGQGDNKIRRVLVISIDGMHALDLALWAKNNPRSAIGQLVAQGLN